MRTPVSALLFLSLSLGACGGDGEDVATNRTAPTPAEKPEPFELEIYGHSLNPDGPPTVRRGGAVTIFGFVRGGPVSRDDREELSVQLWARPAGSGWRKARSQKLSGTIEFRVRPRKKTSFQLRMAEEPTARSKPLRIFVKP